MGEARQRREAAAVFGPVLDCRFCMHERVRSHDPEPDELCPACGLSYLQGCKETHHHNVLVPCFGVDDIRQFECGHYGHKECVKSGGQCPCQGARV